MEGSCESDTAMANVTVALPTYNPDVHSWFQQVETIFPMLRITSQRIKVANLMQKLSPDVISRITDALAELFRRLSHYGLRLNLDKCVFGAPSIEFLGHNTDAEGITPQPTKISAIQDFPTPTSIKQLRRFIGMINFYRRFIPKSSTIL